METQKLLDEIDKLRNELILEQQKKSSLNNEDVQVKEKLYQETKSRANKAEQEVEAQKVRLRVGLGLGQLGRVRDALTDSSSFFARFFMSVSYWSKPVCGFLSLVMKCNVIVMLHL